MKRRSIFKSLAVGVFSIFSSRETKANSSYLPPNSICDLEDGASLDEQLPLSISEQVRIEIESNLGLLELDSAIPSPLPPSTINHLGWPIATVLSSGVFVMAYARQAGHSSGDSSIFAGRYITRSIDLENWNPPGPFPNQAGRIGNLEGEIIEGGAALHAIGVSLLSNGTERVILLTSNREVYISDDNGVSWTLLENRFDGMLTGALQIGPNLINHPAFGMMAVFSQEGPSIDNDRRNYIVRSLDGGESWEERVWLNSVAARSVEPAIATWGDGHMIMIAREYYQPFASPNGRYYHYTQHVYRHEDCSFSEVNFTTARTNIRGNAIIGQSCHDTAEVIFNPITGRIEMIQSHRLGGGPGQTGSTAAVGINGDASDYFSSHPNSENFTQSIDDEPTSSLNIWSIDPDDLLLGSADWRFDGTLLSIKGYSLTSCRDGFHPGGSIVDLQNNKHHIFIYSGARTGPCSIFKISRTLDTDEWRGVSSNNQGLPECMTTGLSDEPSLPSLKVEVFPNPADGDFVKILINSNSFRDLTVDIFNIQGQLVKSVFNGSLNGSNLELQWDATNTQGTRVAGGFYLAVISIDSQRITRKIVIV